MTAPVETPSEVQAERQPEVHGVDDIRDAGQDDWDELIGLHLSRQAVERGLSRNSLDAYGSDLRDFQNFCRDRRVAPHALDASAIIAIFLLTVPATRPRPVEDATDSGRGSDRVADQNVFRKAINASLSASGSPLPTG